LTRPDGAGLSYRLDGTQWQQDPDVNGSLERLADGWRLRDGDDNVVRYDYSGRVVSVTDRAGLAQVYGYNARGQLIRVTDAFGRSLEFTYNNFAEIATMTAPGGLVYRYAYVQIDGQRLLDSVTYPDGRVKRYEYISRGALSAIIDENQTRYARFSYSESGGYTRATSTQHLKAPDEAVDRHTLQYVDDSTVRVTGPLGAVTTYQFSAAFGVARVSAIEETCPTCPGGTRRTTRTYDANGNLASVVDFRGSLTCFTHDLGRNLETRRVEGLSGTACPGTAVAGITRTIETAWDSRFRLPIRETVRDSTGTAVRVTETEYDNRANPVLRRISDPVRNRSRAWAWTHTYSDTVPGVLLESRLNGPRTDVADTWVFAYQPPHNPVMFRRGRLATITNPLGHVTAVIDYDGQGNPMRLLDPNGVEIDLTWDERGRLRTHRIGGSTGAITTFDWRPSGELLRVTRPDGSFLESTYDSARRLTGTLDNLGNRAAFTLDAAGNRIREALFGPDGALVRSSDASYDTLGRLSAALGAAGQRTAYTRDAADNITAITGPRSTGTLPVVTTRVFDVLDRLRAETDPEGGLSELDYDTLDQLTRLRAPNGAQTLFTLDALGDWLSESGPDRGSLQFTRDGAGNAATVRDARGVVATRSFDALNRLTGITYPTSGENVTLVHDAAATGDSSCTHGIGRLCRVTDAAGETRYAYDPRGNVTSARRTELGVTYTTSYTWNGADRLASLTLPTAKSFLFQRNTAGEVVAISGTVAGAAVNFLSQTRYDAAGSLREALSGNGVRRTLTRDADGRDTGITLALPPGADTGGGSSPGSGARSENDIPLPPWAWIALALLMLATLHRHAHAAPRPAASRHGATRTLAALLIAALLAPLLPPREALAFDTARRYDAAGNLIERTDPTGTTTYTYDRLDRLSSESGPARTQAFSHDPNGNRTADGSGAFATVPPPTATAPWSARTPTPPSACSSAPSIPWAPQKRPRCCEHCFRDEAVQAMPVNAKQTSAPRITANRPGCLSRTRQPGGMMCDNAACRAFLRMVLPLPRQRTHGRP
jgi:YD repeat-containing protein